MPVFDLDTKLRIRNNEYFLTFMFLNNFVMRKMTGSALTCLSIEFVKGKKNQKEWKRNSARIV